MVSIELYFRDAVSHRNTIEDSIIPAHVYVFQELIRFFPNKLIIPVLG